MDGLIWLGRCSLLPGLFLCRRHKGYGARRVGLPVILCAFQRAMDNVAGHLLKLNEPCMPLMLKRTCHTQRLPPSHRRTLKKASLTPKLWSNSQNWYARTPRRSAVPLHLTRTMLHGVTNQGHVIEPPRVTQLPAPEQPLLARKQNTKNVRPYAGCGKRSSRTPPHSFPETEAGRLLLFWFMGRFRTCRGSNCCS